LSDHLAVTRLLASLRDGYRELADAIDAYLNANRPLEVKIAEIRESLSGLGDVLAFTEETDSWKVRPRKFLAAEDFSRVLTAVKALGGSYSASARAFVVPKGSTNDPKNC
jgi:hypothetical protein